MGREPELDWFPVQNSDQGEREWHAVIATILSLLFSSILDPPPNPHLPANHQDVGDHQGVILTGPTPLLNDRGLFAQFHNWTFTPTPGTTLQLLPGHQSRMEIIPDSMQTIPLLPADPMGAERFCVIQTLSFCWVAVLRRLPGHGAQCQFSFVPETVQHVLQSLRSRIQLTRPHQLKAFDQCLSQWPTIEPHYRLPLQFSRQLLQIYSQVASPTDFSEGLSDIPINFQASSSGESNAAPSSPDSPDYQYDVDLLKALAHEVRTPLTTIQIFTQLLLKRSDLPAEVLKKLESIRRECHDQINRFSLIFRAMELTDADSTFTAHQLTSILVQEVLQANIPRWQQQADRRNLSLEVCIPQQLPAIAISDPNMLEQVLTGLIEQLSHRLPMGSEIQLQITLAGDQLKLELRSNQPVTEQNTPAETPMLKAIGNLLMLQPETGGLSLSLPVTKHLFEILGGKLTVRQHQQQGEVLTIFLPLGTDSTAY